MQWKPSLLNLGDICLPLYPIIKSALQPPLHLTVTQVSHNRAAGKNARRAHLLTSPGPPYNPHRYMIHVNLPRMQTKNI